MQNAKFGLGHFQWAAFVVTRYLRERAPFVLVAVVPYIEASDAEPDRATLVLAVSLVRHARILSSTERERGPPNFAGTRVV